MVVKNPHLMAPSTVASFQKCFDANFYSVSPVRDEKSGCPIIFYNSNRNKNKYYGDKVTVTYAA